MDEKDNTPLERGASNDIVRLRWRIKILRSVIKVIVAENLRLRNGGAASCETVAPVACDKTLPPEDTDRRSIT